MEGWTPEHDNEHDGGQMALAAAAYAIGSRWNERYKAESGPPHSTWPWERAWWKPASARRMLVKSAALIVAEIERLDRAALARADAAGTEGVK